MSRARDTNEEMTPGGVNHARLLELGIGGVSSLNGVGLVRIKRLGRGGITRLQR